MIFPVVYASSYFFHLNTFDFMPGDPSGFASLRLKTVSKSSSNKISCKTAQQHGTPGLLTSSLYCRHLHSVCNSFTSGICLTLGPVNKISPVRSEHVLLSPANFLPQERIQRRLTSAVRRGSLVLCLTVWIEFSSVLTNRLVTEVW